MESFLRKSSERVPAPWFETGPLQNSRGRLLLATYHFPPSPAVGGLRWQKLASVAAARGWELDVLAADPTGFKQRDEARLQDLPKGVRIFAIGRPTSRPERLERVLLRVRSAFRTGSGSGREASSGGTEQTPEGGTLPRGEIRFNPLRRRDYVRAFHSWADVGRDAAWAAAVRRAGELLWDGGHGYQVVISCGPPHYVHAAASALAARHAVPHVMDLRDPWSLQQRVVEGIASPLWFHLTRRAERRALRRAALLVCNTVPFLKAMREAFPDYPARRIAVLNGWDPETLPVTPPRRQFVIAYAGSIYLDRDPSPLFRAARRVIERRAVGPERFGLAFMGYAKSYDGRTLESLAKEAGIGDFVRVYPSGGRREVLELLSEASVLVSLPQDSDLAIPSKIFEYMRFPAWLLALEKRESATGVLLSDTEAAVVDPQDVEGIAAVLDRCYQAFESGHFPAPIARDVRFSREVQGERLFTAIEAMLPQ